MFLRIHSRNFRTRASGKLRWLLGDLGHLVEECLFAGEEFLRHPARTAVASVAASIWASSSACNSCFGDVARSSSLSTAAAQQIQSTIAALAAVASCLGGFPLPQNGAAMDAQGPGERFHRGEQALLQAGDQKAGGRLLAFALAAQAAVREAGGIGRASRRASSGASAGRPSMSICTTLRSAKAALNLAKVVLEPADHHVVEHLLFHRHATAESLRVEDFQQSREAVGVPIVRRGGQKQPMLEPGGQVANGAGDLRIDGVFLATGRGGMVGFVQDEQRAGAEVAEPIAQRCRCKLRQSASDGKPGSGNACSTD